jgi:hypothetical protein
MVDVARLGLAVDSSQVEKGTVSLHQLTGAAGQASAAAHRLAGASQSEAAGMRTATAATVAHTAAMNANNAAMRMANAQRTNLIFQLNDIGVSLASGMNPLMVLIQQGSQIATIYSGQGGVGMALKETGNLIGGLATRFAPLGAAVGAVSLLLYGFTRQINEANDANVSMVDTAIAMWESLASAVQTTLGPAFTAFGDMLNREIDIFTEEFTREANYLIGLSVGTVDALKAVWGVLPDAIGHLMFEMARGVSNTIVKMQMDILSSMNDLFSRIDTMAISLGGKAFLPRADVYGFGQANYKLEANPFGGGDAIGAAGDAFNNAMGQNYVGNWMKGIGSRAQEIAAARGEMDALGGSAKAANDNLKLLDQGLGNITHWTEAFGSAAKSAFSNLGTGIVEAFRKGGDVATNVLNMLMDKVGQFGETLLNNGLNGLLNMGLNALGGMFGGGTWGVAGGFSGFKGIFGIPGMASGGTVARSGLSWVGEQGPELLRLPAGAQVIPNAPSMAMAANQNGGEIVINNVINVPPGTSADVAPAIAREVTKELRRQLPDAIERHNRNPLRRAG